jgi:hypothetical protein
VRKQVDVPVNSVTTDESIAGRLCRDIMLRHGVDEDSSPEALARQVQAAFTKTPPAIGEASQTHEQLIYLPLAHRDRRTAVDAPGTSHLQIPPS